MSSVSEDMNITRISAKETSGAFRDEQSFSKTPKRNVYSRPMLNYISNNRPNLFKETYKKKENFFSDITTDD